MHPTTYMNVIASTYLTTPCYYLQIHKEERLYVPEMLFGHLLTGSNFDDNDKRITGELSLWSISVCQAFAHSFCYA